MIEINQGRGENEVPKILIVDDKVTNLVALEKLLGELPVAVVRALSGNEALALTLEHDFAVALVDVQMPGMDGFEMVELLRQEQQTLDLPVVFVSAVYSGDYYKIKGVESGAISFLEKPIVPELLLGQVQLFIERHQRKKALEKLTLELENKVRERTVSLQTVNDRLSAEIEQRRTVEKKLQKSLDSLAIAQKVGRLGFYEYNLQTGEGTWSDGFCHLLEIAPGEIPCTHAAFMERVLAEDRELLQQAVADAESDKGSLRADFRLARDSGDACFCQISGKIDFDADSRPLWHRGVMLDVSARKQAELERLALETKLLHTQKLESLGVLAGGIAHDFNNLLMVVLGNADLALMKMSTLAPGRDNIEEVITASKRAAELSRQMLAYSGKGKFAIERVDLGEMLREMTHLLKVSISKTAVLKFNFASNVPPVEADVSQLRQLIMNLVINASEAIGARSGVISVSTGAVHCDRDYMDDFCFDAELAEGYYSYLEVSDTGCGMDEETQAKLFDPFFTTKFTGRGLGLSAVLGIMRGHNGAIKVYSEPNRGSTFKVMLPALMEESLASGDSVAAATAEDWPVQGTVLVADDEESICAVARGMLEHFGFKVLTVPDGRVALEVFKQHAGEIVCVILDLTMPHMDGEECFRELRRLNSNVRVMMSSGYTEYDVQARFAGKGLAGFVQKPYTKDEFERALKKALAVSTAR